MGFDETLLTEKLAPLLNVLEAYLAFHAGSPIEAFKLLRPKILRKCRDLARKDMQKALVIIKLETDNLKKGIPLKLLIGDN